VFIESKYSVELVYFGFVIIPSFVFIKLFNIKDYFEKKSKSDLRLDDFGLSVKDNILLLTSGTNL
jgi:hypothetical protein